MRLTPPKILLRIFRWFCHPELHKYIEGDLLELYEERVKRMSRIKANFRFAWDVLLLFRPGIIRPVIGTQSVNHTIMYGNYFKIALRNLLRRKTYSGINILGLSIAIACCLFIFQYVMFEYSYDIFNDKSATIYRVNPTTLDADGQPNIEANSGWAMGPALIGETPELEHFVRIHPDKGVVISNPNQPNKAFEEDWVYYTDSSFFQMFSYPLISGGAYQSSLASGTVMLSESMSEKYFGAESPLGQILDIKGWINGSYQVSGIFKDTPANSHLRFDFLLPMSDLLKKSRFKNPDTGWDWRNFITYVQLHENADLNTVQEKVTSVFLKHKGEDLKETNTTGYLSLQPLLDIHLNDAITSSSTIMGSYRTVYLFTIIGLVILLIAFVNYINLTTARALDRAQETGIRKVIGAQRLQLIAQFLAESALTIFLALVSALAIFYIFSPLIQNWTGTNFTNQPWDDPYLWLVFPLLFCVSTLLAGLYPSLLLSTFKPIDVLKGKGMRSGRGIWLRKALVVFQFTTSIVLLTGTLIVHFQVDYILNMDTGMGLEQVITVPAPRILSEKSKRSQVIETFTQKLEQFPDIQQTATSHALPGKGFSLSTDHVRRISADPSNSVPASAAWIDNNFANVYGLKLISGNGFENISLTAADEEPFPVIANRTAIESIGFDTPEEAIEQQIDLADGNLCYIVGVYEDFNWSSAHDQRENAFYFLGKALSHISIKVNSENLPETIANIEMTYKQLFPGNPFQYAFAHETFEAQYGNDQRLARLFKILAVLAIFIAGLGLFGLATFTAEQRKTEVGIRKVLGATLANVILLLTQDFLRLVMIGFLVAIPITWYIMSQWLEDFAYRIEIGFEVFLISGLAAVVLALLTVSWQSFKAATANPVSSIKNE